MPASLLTRFGGRCAYCGSPPPLVEEHLVPINRTALGLHAWGNIVPACRSCNDIKAGNAWQDHPQLDALRRAAIRRYIDDYGYAPDVAELRVVLGKLYELANVQTRALVDFGLVASRPYIAGLHVGTPEPEADGTP